MTQGTSGPKSSWVIGRDPRCDLVVQDNAVSSRHCRLTQQDSGFTVEDLNSTNGTFVNGVRIVAGEPVHVPHGGHVTLGAQIEMPWPPAEASRPARSVTMVSGGPQAGRAGSRAITIGRDPESSVQIDLPIVSWNHAVITEEGGQYFIEDLNSRNGTSIGQLSNRIQRAALDPSSEVYLGSYKIAASQLLSGSGKTQIGEAAFNKVAFPGGKNEIEIGRDPACDIPLLFPMVSWRHARLTRAPQGILVEDLGSRNGTYVDGVRITARVLVKPGQEIGLGSFRFQLLAGGELAQRQYHGNVTIQANDIVVCAPNGKRLLDPVSLTVFPSELVALMGPAGAGKTTLLKALNGYTPPVEGTVLFNGVNLYQFYNRFRHQMGYVPQDDIVHPQLTVEQALYFSARLRTDLTDAEIAARTKTVLDDLGIADKATDIIGSPERKVLSGGQRKRVNIALELITDTPVLFLDEPTSGLSSYDADAVVDLLKGLSKSGKTIITTIHQPSLKVYKQFDDLIMVSRDKGRNGEHRPGAMVYFGPAYPDSVQFFNPLAANSTVPVSALELNPEMLFTGMNKVEEGSRTDTWRKRYQASRYQKEFVAGRRGKQPAEAAKAGQESARREFGISQWFALVRRNVAVKLQDTAQTSILLAQAPFFAALVCLIATPLEKSDFQGLAEKLLIAHFLMVVAAIWFGCNNAARDIVGEWTIYKRERMVTLKLLPYVFSKLAVLMALCVFQCGSMLGIVYVVCGLHSNFLYDFLILMLASMLGAGLGLSISAISKTNESAIALLPVVLLPIIALGGGMRPIYEMPTVGRIVSMAIPSKWAFEANLLQEAKAKEWKPEMPALPAMPQLPPGASPKGSKPPLPAMPMALPQMPEDVAQHTLPSYVIAFSDDKGDHLRAATAEEYPAKNPAAKAIKFRHSYRVSAAVLATMLVLLVVAVIGILRKRDNDPQ